MRTLPLAAAGLLCLATSLSAQQNIIYNDGASATNSGGNAFPWGSEGIRYQMIVPQSVLGAKPGWINDLFVTGRTSANNIVYGDIEIRMGVTTISTLTSTWATNNPNPTTVYRGPLRVEFEVDTWKPIGLPRSYFWLPKAPNENLCLEIIVHKVTDKGNTTTAPNFYFPGVSSTQGRAFRYQWTTNTSQNAITSASSGASRLGIVFGSGNFVVVGEGCKGSNGAPQIGTQTGVWPQVAKPFPVQLSGAPAGRPVFAFFGFNNAMLGAIPLPFDLQPLGASGCMVWNDFVWSAGTATDKNGDASLNLVVPPVFPRIRIYAHYWVGDPTANAFGFTTTGSALAIFDQ